MLETYEKNSTKKLVATCIAITLIAGSTVLADQLKNKVSATNTLTAQAPSSQTTIAATNTPTVSATTTSGYADGTYAATSYYYVPHGSETIRVDVTLSHGVITDTSVQNSKGDHDSARYQENFASVYKNYVIGKKISDLKLGVIAGASDTTAGFNDALAQIATKAQA